MTTDPAAMRAALGFALRALWSLNGRYLTDETGLKANPPKAVRVNLREDIKRLEGLLFPDLPAGPELNALVEKEVLRWEVVDADDYGPFGPSDFSGNLVDAMTLAEQFRLHVGPTSLGWYCCDRADPLADDAIYEVGPTMAVAICRCALKVKAIRYPGE